MGRVGRNQQERFFRSLLGQLQRRSRGAGSFSNTAFPAENE
jgi:hypothetical protein